MSWEFLDRIARAYVGEPVITEPLSRSDKGWGLAEFDGCWRVKLRADLFAERREELAKTFFHELAHIVLGHVPRKARSHRTYDLWEAEARAADSELFSGLAERIRRNEAEADAWADRELAATRAKIGDNPSFEDLACD